MIKKFTSGNPIDTQAVVEKFNALPIAEFPLGGKFENGNFVFEFDMADSDIVYGLGEAPRGINKRGWVYNSFCSDDPFHTETKSSLYAAHNFLMLSGSKTFGIFIDFPSKIRWDIGYTTTNKTVITIDGTDFDIYYIDATKPLEIVKEFRKSIGTSYVPPFWAFGYQQSRWSYHNAEAVDAVVDGYNKAEIPLDCVYLDIDYMERYKDFTVDDEKFPNFKDYVSKKREEGIHLIPIIDAGVKKENGYDIYEEGRKNGYFCKNEDGTDFEGGVWPGIVGFPDFLRPDVRKWFGSKYKILTDMGIDGFWNDMNEPAIFYSVKGLNKALDKYVGAHRSSGIWFGDNHSWWSHILLDLKMLPSANMCGFLYCGADLGGFNENATRDLVLRFLALGVFTPLMRNHAALGTRNQECYSFENSDDFKDIVEVRYRLIPYLYRTFKKASEENDMIFRPLSFDYPDDKIARECETQLMLGDECMICPVYEQNVAGRYVYLPEDMTFVKLSGTSVTTEKMSKGTHYIEVALNEVPLFIKDGRQIELCKPAMRTSQLDTTDTIMIP